MTRRVIIIGAGIGGLSLSIYLARHGFEVEIVEKQDRPGGRCSALEQGGHRFDAGATLLLMPRLVRSIYADWGQSLENHLDLLPLDPIYDLHFERGARLRFTPQLPGLMAQMERIEEGSFERFLRCFDLGWRQYQRLMSRFLGRNFDRPWSYFNPANGYYFLALKAYRNHHRHVCRYFKSPQLQAAFTFQNIYVGQSPFATSAAYALLPAVELAQGGWYPRGGMSAVAGSLEAMAREAGVRFHYGAAVRRIVIRSTEARAVSLDDGTEMEADIIAANADLPYVYRCLLPDSGRPRRLDRMGYTCSALVFYWGLARRQPDLGHHSIFVGEDYRAGFDGIFGGKGMCASPHFYVNRPASTDPSAAPPGKDSLTVIVPVHNLQGRGDEGWQGLTGRARDAVFARLAASGLGGLAGDVESETVHTPRDWAAALNLTHGAVFGSLDHRVTQVGYLRPSSRHAAFKNLYFVGGSTHPGSGVPLALLSGRLTAERILRAAGRKPAFGELQF